MTESISRILYVDDESFNLRLFKLTFQQDFEIHVAATAADGLKLLDQLSFRTIVSDMKMPDMSGVEFLERARVSCPDSLRIIVSGMTGDTSIDQAIANGVVSSFVPKPWQKVEFMKVLEQSAT